MPQPRLRCVLQFATLLACVLFVISSAATVAAQIEFDSMAVKKIKFKPPKKPPLAGDAAKKILKTKLIVKGTFTLGAGSDGVDCMADAVRVSVSAQRTVVDSEFVGAVKGSSCAAFKDKSLNALKVIKLKQGSGGEWKYLVKGTRLSIGTPVALTFELGDDFGQVDLASGAQQSPPLSSVSGTVVTGIPAVGLAGVTIRMPCPSGTCTAVTDASGRFQVASNAVPSGHEFEIDGSTASAATYPRLRHFTSARVGSNEAGTFALPAIDTSNGTVVSAGLQAAPVTITSNPVTTGSGGTVSIDIPAGATVTFPAGTGASALVSITQIPLDLVPMRFTTAGSPLVVSAQPGGTTISPCADITFDNPTPGVADGTTVDIYNFDHTLGDWAVIGSGTVSGGGTQIVAPGVLCEFAWSWPSSIALDRTDISGRVMFNGSPIAGVPVYVAGASEISGTAANPADANYLFPQVWAGVPGFPFTFATWDVTAQKNLGAGGLLIGTTGPVAAVLGNLPTPMPDLNLTLQACGGHLLTWGSAGSAAGQFSGAQDIAAGSTVYVADTGNDRIQRFDTSGGFLDEWGTTGSGASQFIGPTAIALDSVGNVYVSDAGNNRIQKFTSAGVYLNEWGSGGSGPGQFGAPMGIAIDRDDRVYVADTANHRIQRFGANGTFELEWPTIGVVQGVSLTQDPIDVAIGYAGSGPAFPPQVHVYQGKVELFQKLLVRRYDASGAPLGSFVPVPAISADALGIETDVYGDLYVVNGFEQKAAEKLTKYATDGSTLTFWGKSGVTDGEFMGVSGVAVDLAGNVYTVEQTGNRVQKFQCP